MSNDESAQQPKPAWSVSTVKITAALQANSPTVDDTYGKTIPLNDLQYTILDEHNVYYNRRMLSELYTATDEAPKNLTVFRPHRIALHLLIAHVSTTLALKDEDELRNVVLGIYKSKEFVEKMDSIYKELDSKRNKIEEKMEKLIATLIDGENVSKDSQFSPEEISAAKDAIKRVKIDNIKKLGNKIFKFDFKMAVTTLAVDSLYKAHAEKRLNPMLSQLVHDHAIHNHLQSLMPVAPDSMMVLMVAGGQASGKGTSVAQTKNWLETQKKISWNQVIKINTDSYKPLVLDAKSVKPDLYSQLAQEEASLVHLAVHKRIESLAADGKHFHHIFVDQVFVGKDKIELATKNKGMGFITIVSTDVEDAIERSYKRGEAEGRFENTEGILTCHKNMAAQAMEVLSKFVGHKVYVSLVDNNVPKGKQPISFMDIDLESKKATIHNKELLERFIKKTLINFSATSKKTLYQQDTVDIDVFLKPLRDAGVTITYSSQQSLSASTSTDNPENTTTSSIKK